MDLIELSKENNYRHPWELSRGDSLVKEVLKYHTDGRILDIGCGDLYFDRLLSNKGKGISELWGVDINAERDLTEGVCHWVNDYKKIKPKKFETIIMMDVLEHIEHDVDFLSTTIKPYLSENGGKIILTVPAFQFLFSNHDRALKHYRRYNIKQLKKVCESSGLRVKNYHYFYFSLLPLRLLTKILKGKDAKLGLWKYSKDSIITKSIRNFLNLDYKTCALLGPFSFGLSLFAVIKKKTTSEN